MQIVAKCRPTGLEPGRIRTLCEYHSKMRVISIQVRFVLFVAGAMLAACDGQPNPTFPAAIYQHAPPVEASCTAFCDEAVACAPDTSDRDECVRNCTHQGVDDPMAAPVVADVMGHVVARCSHTSCDKLADCYLDTVDEVENEFLSVATARDLGSPQQRMGFMELIADGASKHTVASRSAARVALKGIVRSSLRR